MGPRETQRRAAPKKRSRGEPGISADIVGPVARALAGLGFTVPAAPAGAVVPGPMADALIEEAASKLGRPALGLDLSQQLPLGALGTLDYALVTSATLREALERTARFYGLATQRVHLTLVEQPPHARLVFERPGDSHSRHWVEFAHGIVTHRMRQAMGVEFQFVEITFRHPPPADRAPHDAYFGVATKFSQPHDSMCFPHALLAQPMRTASASLAAVLEAKMRQLEPALGSDPFLTRASIAVAELVERQHPTLGSTAQRMGTTSRTLQRELQKRDTSFQALVDEARRARAQVLLDDGFSVSEVSERLGFSEPSAFFRAFRRWTGQTPKNSQRGGRTR